MASSYVHGVTVHTSETKALPVVLVTDFYEGVHRPEA